MLGERIVKNAAQYPEPVSYTHLDVYKRQRAGREDFHMEPRMIFQQRCKALPNHSRCADDADVKLFHFTKPL